MDTQIIWNICQIALNLGFWYWLHYTHNRVTVIEQRLYVPPPDEAVMRGDQK